MKIGIIKLTRMLSLLILLLMFAEEVQAIIGMPLTPLSYTGVARRTVRRAAWGWGVAPYYGMSSVRVIAASTSTTPTALGTTIATLPDASAGIYINGALYYICEGVYYRPYYNGPNLVYVVSQP